MYRFYVGGQPLWISTPVPAGHKVATRDIARGAHIIKYRQTVGVALCDIATGEHVHVHNVGMPERHQSARPSEDAMYRIVETGHPDTFRGYVRADGQVGTRNYIGVIASVNCSASVCHAIADAFKGDALDVFAGVDGVVAETGQDFRLSALQGGLLWEALSRLVSTRARALELAIDICRRQGNAAPDVHDVHLPVIIELQRQFSGPHD